MKIAILGLGAVGGHFAARLAADGHEVSAIARGPVHDRLRHNPIELHSGGQTIRADIQVSESAEGFSKQDAILLTAKAHSLPTLSQCIAPLIHSDTLVVFAQNGIPWWYGDGLPRHLTAPPDLSFLDRQGVVRQQVPIDRVVGGVIHSTNEMTAPGIVNNPSSGNSLFLGLTDDRADPRLTKLRAALTRSGIDSPPVSDIRFMIWRKALLNMTSSIICLLMGCRLSELAQDDGLRRLVSRAYGEALAIAGAHGIETRDFSIEKFLANAPAHLPSIRQDFDRRRPLELDALVVAPQKFAHALGLDTPCLESIAALAIHKARRANLYPSGNLDS